MKQIISITREAQSQLNKTSSDVFLSVNNKGCGGHKYQFDVVGNIEKFDEIIPINDKFNLIVKNSSILFLLGTTMSWKQDEYESKFVFENPNAKNLCGCGESFSI